MNHKNKAKSVRLIKKNVLKKNRKFRYDPTRLKKYYFHVFREELNEARLMCSYNTEKKDIIEFIKNLNL